MAKIFEKRNYQERIHEKSLNYLQTPKDGVAHSLLIESPTGSGKTVMAMRIAKWLENNRNYDIGWIAHRKELLNQAIQTNEEFFNCKRLNPISMFTRHPEQYRHCKVVVIDECLPEDSILHVLHNGEKIKITIGAVVNQGVGTHVLSRGNNGLEYNLILNRTPMGRKEIYEVIIKTDDGEFVLPITAEGRVYADGKYRRVTDLTPGMTVESLASYCHTDAKCESEQKALSTQMVSLHQKVQNVHFQSRQASTSQDDYPKTGSNYQRDHFGRRKYRLHKKSSNQVKGNHQTTYHSINEVQTGSILEIRATGQFTKTYDIGVDKVHNFYADGFLVHNCQHDASQSCAILHQVIKPEIIIGLTATPYRTDRAQLCFQKVIRDAGIRQLIREGYLAQFNQWVMDKEWTPENVANIYLQDPEKWGKSVIYFLTIDEASKCDEILRKNGVSSALITGKSPRSDILDKFKTDEIKVLSNVAVLTEGFDEPSLQSVFVRPGSKGPTVQMAGRVFRKYPGIPVVNVVQNNKTKYPFTKHARAANQYLQQDNNWVSIDARNLKNVFRNQLSRIAKAKVTMPTYLQKKNGLAAFNEDGIIDHD